LAGPILLGFILEKISASIFPDEVPGKIKHNNTAKTVIRNALIFITSSWESFKGCPASLCCNPHIEPLVAIRFLSSYILKKIQVDVNQNSYKFPLRWDFFTFYDIMAYAVIEVINGKYEVAMMFKRRITIFLFLFYVLLLNAAAGTCCSGSEVKESQPRSGHWAPAIERGGLPNFYKVSDSLYRGAQPRKQGFEELKKLGIKTVVNLRRSHREQIAVKEAGLKYYQIPMFAFFPQKEKFARFLKIVSNPSNHPVFVHCKHGADRTGAAIAIYRIKIQNWNVEEAINEMVNGGYNFHRIYRNLKKFVRRF
jgi:protein tyrosine phosphatase (PTP) superfamily phosphohydrolase (DUF442 family)